MPLPLSLPISLSLSLSLSRSLCASLLGDEVHLVGILVDGIVVFEGRPHHTFDHHTSPPPITTSSSITRSGGTSVLDLHPGLMLRDVSFLLSPLSNFSNFTCS